MLFISLPSHQCLTNISSKLNMKPPTATHKHRGEAEGRLQGLQILLQGLRAALPWDRQGSQGLSPWRTMPSQVEPSKKEL